MKTICISCGSAKHDYRTACPDCGFQPTTREELAKSRVLSEPWDFGLPDGSIVATGRSSEELESIASILQSGGEYQYPPDELSGMIWVIGEAESMTGKDVATDVVRWLLPPVALAAVVWYLIAKFG